MSQLSLTSFGLGADDGEKANRVNFVSLAGQPSQSTIVEIMCLTIKVIEEVFLQ